MEFVRVGTTGYFKSSMGREVIGKRVDFVYFPFKGLIKDFRKSQAKGKNTCIPLSNASKS